MATTHALTVPEHGGADVLTVTEVEVADPGPGEVQVEVGAVGVNFIDVYQRQGVYPMSLPYVACSEGAGTVVAVGEGAGLEVGDRVAWAMDLGSAAGVVNRVADRVVPVPDGVSLEQAAALMLQGMTAHYLVTDTYAVSAGTTALVHAAAGGVGQLLVQMLVARGATVVATAGSAEKLEIARSLGAQHLIDYATVCGDELADAVRAAVGGGVDVAYDGVGAATFDASLASLRPRGMMVLFGGASGQVPPFDIQRLNAGGSLFLTRPTLASYIATRDELLERGTAVLAAVAAGDLLVDVGGAYPMEEAAAAYADLEGRRSRGKLLLVP